MSDAFPYPTGNFDRGKVLDKDGLNAAKTFARYKDVDGDGIPYRTLPGTHHPQAPYFTRGSGHTESAGYTEDSDEYKVVLDRLKRKIAGSVKSTPRPVIEGEGDIGLIHFGSSSFAVDEAREILGRDGVRTRSLRLRALPLHDEGGGVRALVSQPLRGRAEPRRPARGTHQAEGARVRGQGALDPRVREACRCPRRSSWKRWPSPGRSPSMSETKPQPAGPQSLAGKPAAGAPVAGVPGAGTPAPPQPAPPRPPPSSRT